MKTLLAGSFGLPLHSPPRTARPPNRPYSQIVTHIPTGTVTLCTGLHAHSPLRLTDTKTHLYPHHTGMHKIQSAPHCARTATCTELQVHPGNTLSYTLAHSQRFASVSTQKQYTQGHAASPQLLGHALWNTHTLPALPLLLLLVLFLPQHRVARTTSSPQS